MLYLYCGFGRSLEATEAMSQVSKRNRYVPGLDQPSVVRSPCHALFQPEKRFGSETMEKFEMKMKADPQRLPKSRRDEEGGSGGV